MGAIFAGSADLQIVEGTLYRYIPWFPLSRIILPMHMEVGQSNDGHANRGVRTRTSYCACLLQARGVVMQLSH